MNRFDRVDHTAIVVQDLDEAIARWSALTGASIGRREIVEHQGVEIAMLRVGDTQIELICPLSKESGVGRYLAKRREAMHHIGFQVEDIDSSLAALQMTGVELIDTAPRETSHGRIAFVHPRSTGGVLVELVEAKSRQA